MYLKQTLKRQNKYGQLFKPFRAMIILALVVILFMCTRLHSFSCSQNISRSNTKSNIDYFNSHETHKVGEATGSLKKNFFLKSFTMVYC